MKSSAMKTTILSAFCFVSISFVACLDKKDVYESLWTENMGLANRTLNLDFIRRMEVGDLPADRYVNFTIQDINYLVKVTKMLRKVSNSVKEPTDLKKFFQGRFQSYKSFRDYLLSIYFLKSASDIKATPAMRKYLSDYETIMHTKEPIYFAVSLLPCSRLWGWLANQVNITQTNAYFAWKKDNMGGHPDQHYKELLNKHLDTRDKVSEAERIFRMQMQNEHNFFESS
ncbi:uncharacterized protein LOC134062556 [Sardina pilchardus]|uniref:uncharacterized protein LOC134062556 n=1 Tax=Sardina pilchardus TaxID=27697 RepID=UPI002E15271E